MGRWDEDGDDYLTWTLHEGDCLEVMKTLPSESVDAVITDPPYGIDLQPQRKKTCAIIGDKNDEARELWAAFIPEAHRIAKGNTSHIFWSAWSEVWVKELLEKHFTVKTCIVWVKNNFGIGYYTRPQHEFAWYCHKGKPPKPDKAISNVWNFKRLNKPIHSCQKPTELIEQCITFCSKQGDTILDPFAGSGTTGVACENTGRNSILIEREPKYCNIIRERMNALQGRLII